MKFTHKVVLTFKDVFPNEKPQSIDFYLEGISKEFLIKSGTFLLSFSQSSPYNNPKNFLEMYFSRENQEIINEIWRNILVFTNENKYEINNTSLAYIVSSLSFFEHCYDKEYIVQRESSNQEIEILIFKAYLLFNEANTTHRSEILNETTKSLSVLKNASAVFICLQLNNYEVTNYDIVKVFVTQYMKALSFFVFLDGIPEAKKLLRAFYNYYEVDNYKEFLKKILPIALSIINRDKEAHIDLVLDGSDKDKSIRFLSKFSVLENSKLTDYDFKNIRSNPLIRVKDDTFRIILPLYALELIGNGLFFKLNEVNDTLTKNEKVKNLYGLKNLEYSEQYILNNTLSDLFGNKYIQKTGLELDGLVDGAPDYYVRNGNKILLFESKDILVNGKIKQSSDFNLIANELQIKLYKSQTGSPKAVLQLINNIKKILTDNLVFDTNFKSRNVYVYPILVVHNRAFNTAGINKWVNLLFQEELNNLKKDGLDTSKIKSLIIIDIDTLIYNKDYFIDKKVNYQECLDSYCKENLDFTVEGKKFKSEEEAIQATKNSYISFSDILDTKIDKLGRRKPPRDFIANNYGLFN